MFTILPVHNYYISFCEIHQNEETRSLEISIQFITHDLEDVLSEFAGEKVVIDTGKRHDEILEAYINQHFCLTMNDNQQKELIFWGKEVEYEDTWCYLELPYDASVNAGNMEINLVNSLLIAQFEKQSNIVNLFIGEQSKRLTFHKDNTQQSVSFDASPLPDSND